MDQGPVLVITFQAFMINVVKNSEGKVVSGDSVRDFQFYNKFNPTSFRTIRSEYTMFG